MATDNDPVLPYHLLHYLAPCFANAQFRVIPESSECFRLQATIRCPDNEIEYYVNYCDNASRKLSLLDAFTTRLWNKVNC